MRCPGDVLEDRMITFSQWTEIQTLQKQIYEDCLYMGTQFNPVNIWNDFSMKKREMHLVIDIFQLGFVSINFKSFLVGIC